ncbi:nonribosomal peptide synthetase 6 [Sporormia fimetaria CBS 119925]|uniref:Nonribosomal peptide synthetase 6 n=1 Tax=Sporormia fimetaria CBS 119925 TaxID=1340428 RepID=A0A6A6VHY4_9PLEO|nr:nonribosomal peptide synthetase 6 [Sporormia fimetaria CBS 119925]
MDAKASPGNGIYTNEAKKERPRNNEVLIPVPPELLEAVLAGWVLMMQRYQRDTFHTFTWGLEESATNELQSVPAFDLKMSSITTIADLVDAVRRVRSKDILVQPTDTTLTFNDGTKDEWTFQASVHLQQHQLRATCTWREPALSRCQALSQLDFFASAVRTAFTDQTKPLHEVLAFTPPELDEIWSWNTPLPPTVNTCAHTIISQQAQMYPDKVALDAWDGTLTYAQVDRYSTHLAQNILLIDDGISIVPLLFEKSRWTIVALLAVMKAGKCFAMLDPAQPEGRLKTIVEQTHATLIVASKSQAALAAQVAPKATVIPISGSKFDKVYTPFAEQQPNITLPQVPPTAPLYIQFTSGSTGKPKGCVISHSQYSSGVIPRGQAVGYHSNSRVLDFASYAFDVSIDSMLCTLAFGGTLCTPSDERRMNDLSGAMRDMKVTLAGMTPSVARTLAADIWEQLETLAVGGEGVSASDAKTWRKSVKVVNCYGPSECTVGCTINSDVAKKPYITMGKGTGAAIWVVDPADHNKLVPVGAVGELLVEGPLVGDGYLENPEKTKEVFIENPDFLTRGSPRFPGRTGRLYKTGDLVRYDPDGDGEVMFVGRQDQQVKLRGQRIELAEIEYNIQKHLPHGTPLAAEVIKPGGTGDPVLVAFVVDQTQSGNDPADGSVFGSFSLKFQKQLQEMMRQITKDLPGYMVPTALIPLWKMPLLVSCKTDRKRLREIGTSITRKDLRKFSVSVSEKVEPTTETELKLRELWAEVLGGESDFAASDNFFRMGGDSLRAMRLVAAARDEGILISVPNIMLNPTLSAMAAKATKIYAGLSDDVPAFSLLPSDWSSEYAKAEVSALCGTEHFNIEDVYPCTALQEGLMALSAKFADAYVAQRVVELPVDVALKLGNAFHKAAKDCAILRTRIVNVAGRGLFQVVLKEPDFGNAGLDLQQYLEDDRAQPMELGSALFRYAVITPENSAKGYVITSLHHAVYDGWSMPLVVERVNRAYHNMETKRGAEFKHFIRYLTTVDRAESEKFWRNQLQGANPHQFPPVPYKSYTMRADSLLEHYVRVPTSLQSQNTLATVIRGAWGLVSSMYLRSPDVVFGETLTGRSVSVPGVEQIEGPMITTIPFRVRLDRGTTVSEYLNEVHAQTVRTIPHEHLGLQNIRRLSREARDACDLKTGLVLHPKEDEDWSDSPRGDDAPADGFVPTNDEEAAREALKFNTYALMLVCTLDANGFLIMASFDSNCISSPVMERVLGVLDRIVLEFCNNSEKRLGDVAMLEEEERKDAESFKPKEPIHTQLDTAAQTSGTGKETDRKVSLKEEKLRDILARILNMSESDISPSDSFFELGGDSITAMRLVSEARAQDLTLTVGQVFESKSLSTLAASAEFGKEDKLLGLLSRILSIPTEDINAADSFTELGGDSIGAMRLVSEARAQGLKVTVQQVFESRSLSDLAALAVEETSQETLQVDLDAPFSALGLERDIVTPDAAKPRLENQDWKIQNIYPTRPLQHIAIEGTVDTTRYSLRYDLIQFAAQVDEAQLLGCCQALVNQNEVLRTVFVSHSGRTFGVVLETLRVPFDHISVPTDTDLLAYAHEYTQKDISEPKPYGSSFAAFALLTQDSGQSILVFRISHAQYDEMCLPLLYDQLAALYTGTTLRTTAPFSRHINHVINHAIPTSVPYWQSLLANSKMTNFKPDIPLTTRNPTYIYREFDISSRPTGITIGSLPTAAWALILAHRLQTRDVVFGEVVTGRNIGVPEADRIVGPTWQYAPFRVSFQDNWTYLDLLRIVQNQHIASAPHESMGLSEIVEQCTDWDPKEVTWFDSVVHQAPAWVESLEFGGVQAKFETVYPHTEPLREWKCQAFVKEGGKKLGIEIVTYEEWRSVGEEVLGEVGEMLGRLVGERVGERVF